MLTRTYMVIVPHNCKICEGNPVEANSRFKANNDVAQVPPIDSVLPYPTAPRSNTLTSTLSGRHYVAAESSLPRQTIVATRRALNLKSQVVGLLVGPRVRGVGQIVQRYPRDPPATINSSASISPDKMYTRYSRWSDIRHYHSARIFQIPHIGRVPYL